MNDTRGDPLARVTGREKQDVYPARPMGETGLPQHQLRSATSTSSRSRSTESNGKTQKKWTRIGAAFPHKDGIGFSIELKAFPVDGRLVVLPPDSDDNRNK